MTLTRYEPWTAMSRLHRELDQLFGDTFGTPEAASASNVAWIPAVDVHEEKDRFVVRADLPGVEQKDIEITAEDGILTIRGERRGDRREENGQGYERIERTYGTFLRRFTLPETAQAEAIKAKHANGVLEVSIPKQPKVEPRKIRIDSN
jgi:HSP20 family protein